MYHTDGIGVSLRDTGGNAYFEYPNQQRANSSESLSGGSASRSIGARPGEEFEVVLTIEKTFDLRGADGLYVAVAMGAASTIGGASGLGLTDGAQVFYLDAVTLKTSIKHSLSGRPGFYGIATTAIPLRFILSVTPHWSGGLCSSNKTNLSRLLIIPNTQRTSVLVSRVTTAVSHRAVYERFPRSTPGQKTTSHFWPSVFPEGFARPLDGLDGYPYIFHFRCGDLSARPVKTMSGITGFEPRQEGVAALVKVTGRTTTDNAPQDYNSNGKRAHESSSDLEAVKKPRLASKEVAVTTVEEHMALKYDLDLEIKRAKIVKEHELALELVDIEMRHRLLNRMRALSVHDQAGPSELKSEDGRARSLDKSKPIVISSESESNDEAAPPVSKRNRNKRAAKSTAISTQAAGTTKKKQKPVTAQCNLSFAGDTAVKQIKKALKQTGNAKPDIGLRTAFKLTKAEKKAAAARKEAAREEALGQKAEKKAAAAREAAARQEKLHQKAEETQARRAKHLEELETAKEVKRAKKEANIAIAKANKQAKKAKQRAVEAAREQKARKKQASKEANARLSDAKRVKCANAEAATKIKKEQED